MPFMDEPPGAIALDKGRRVMEAVILRGLRGITNNAVTRNRNGGIRARN